ncbi:MAG: sigma-54 dependent transcriptional regulator [Pseudomonadota bacterium]
MKTSTVLIADQDLARGSALTALLQRGGIATETAAARNDVVDLLETKDYAAVIVDESFSPLPTEALITTVRRRLPDCRFIVTTGCGTVGNAVAVMQAGADDYIMKPASAEKMGAAVMKALNARVALPVAKTEPVNRTEGLVSRPIITDDTRMATILTMARRVAPSKANVLILGESGTGKELMARFIHENSRVSKGPFVAMNCAALPETLAESELFGHEKGAFTGAISRKLGKFELADGGTLVLDEISEMDLPLQAKLLRVLQERLVDRVGGSEPIPIDVRVVAISNVDLKGAVKKGDFREDLFYRLNVIPITLPPLRERSGDLLLLATHFIDKCCVENGLDAPELSEAAVVRIRRHPWHGNIRELENVMERAVLVRAGDPIEPADLYLDDDACETEDGTSEMQLQVGMSVREMEKRLISHTLRNVDNNRIQAAELLGISIRTLRNKLREYQERDAA